MGTNAMRFAVMLAAIAALWVQPAGAVTIVLSSPTPGVVTHQKVTLTGLNPGDTIGAEAHTGSSTNYWWEFFSGSWLINGNGFAHADCFTGSSGQCHNEFSVQSPSYPISIAALVNIQIVDNDIFVDWFKSPSVQLCFGIPEAERIAGSGNHCGYVWGDQNLSVSFDVTSGKAFGYSVTSLPNPVPEPATWAMIIMGIGMAGMVIRHRHPHAV